MKISAHDDPDCFIVERHTDSILPKLHAEFWKRDETADFNAEVAAYFRRIADMIAAGRYGRIEEMTMEIMPAAELPFAKLELKAAILAHPDDLEEFGLHRDATD